MKKGTIIDFIFRDLILYSPPGPGTFRGLNMAVTPEEDVGTIIEFITCELTLSPAQAPDTLWDINMARHPKEPFFRIRSAI